MTDRPIIFSAPMVRALLDGRKTQTRRILKPQPEMNSAGLWVWPPYGQKITKRTWRGLCQTDEAGIKNWFATNAKARETLPALPGDRLWVREAFSYETLDVDRDGFMPPWYWADGNPESGDFTRPKPSIHMPRWASRLTLTVTDVRVQRLQEISADDAEAEGLYRGKATGHFWEGRAECRFLPGMSHQEAFRNLWDDLHGPGAWGENPWVCALTFSVERRNIDAGEVVP